MEKIGEKKCGFERRKNLFRLDFCCKTNMGKYEGKKVVYLAFKDLEMAHDRLDRGLVATTGDLRDVKYICDLIMEVLLFQALIRYGLYVV